MGKFEQFDTSTNSQNSNTWSTLHDDAYSFAQYKDDKSPSSNSQSRTFSVNNFLDLDHKEAKRRYKEDLDRYDKNGNGKLDDREIDHAMQNSESISDWFRYSTLKIYDKNRDGIIDDKEQKKIDEDNEKARKEALKKYDTNRDGKLDDKEREKQFSDLFKDKRPPVSDKEFKEQVEESVHDLKVGIKRNDLRDLVRDIDRAREMMPLDQFEKYLKALNHELRKINPTLEIAGSFSQNGKRWLYIKIP